MVCKECMGMAKIVKGKDMIDCPVCGGKGELDGSEQPEVNGAPNSLPAGGAVTPADVPLDEVPPPAKRGKGKAKAKAKASTPAKTEAEIRAELEAKIRAEMAAEARVMGDGGPTDVGPGGLVGPTDHLEELTAAVHGGEPVFDEKVLKAKQAKQAKQKSTELVVSETKTLPVEAPEKLAGLAAIFSRTNTDLLGLDLEPEKELESSLLDVSAAALLPRLCISQGLSDVVTSGKLPSGVWYRSDTEQNLGKVIYFVVLGHVQQRLCFNKDDMRRLECAAFGNPIRPDFGAKFAPLCAKCEMSQWGADGETPQCGESRVFLVMAYAMTQLDDGTYTEGEPFVATIPHRRASIPVAKNLANALVGQERRGYRCTRIRVAGSFELVKGPKGTYWSPMYKILPMYIVDEAIHQQLVDLKDEWMPVIRRAPKEDEVDKVLA